jgi:uncharacterized membrane protein YccF (DUF307 family)
MNAQKDSQRVTLILNILWLIFGGGLVMGVGWLLAACLMAITIIGLPWTPAALRIAAYTLLPFGYTVVERDAGAVSLLGNVIWFVLAGWWLALAHVVLAVALAVTLIGLPFAWAHLKLALLSLMPVGKEIVPTG